MDAVKELLTQARNLSQRDQRRLIEGLESSLIQSESAAKPASAGRLYTRSLELAGSVETDFGDVSADKYSHVARAYAAKQD